LRTESSRIKLSSIKGRSPERLKCSTVRARRPGSSAAQCGISRSATNPGRRHPRLKQLRSRPRIGRPGPVRYLRAIGFEAEIVAFNRHVEAVERDGE
jgi:hypothetical protein